MKSNTHKSGHTMTDERLRAYCMSKVHSLFADHPEIKEIVIHGAYRRDKPISMTEKRDKLFNFKRPTAEIVNAVGHLYCFPGQAHAQHYGDIYRQTGYSVKVIPIKPDDIRLAIRAVFPHGLPEVDTIILGYVDFLAPDGKWDGNDNIKWKVQTLGSRIIAFVGVSFSYWGDIIYYLTEPLAPLCKTIIYAGKLGSLHIEDVPNRTIATGSSSYVDGERITWNNLFANSPLATYGDHITVPSILQETKQWLQETQHYYRYVDPELGWIAKSARDNNIQFSYLHLVTDNLTGKYNEDLTTEREEAVLRKRLQYVGIIKSIIWHSLASQQTSMMAAVLKAQQSRVDRNILKPLIRDWKACLSFAYHTQEEACEIVRELPRREWKNQEVQPEKVLSEIADTQIQLMTTLAYAGFTEQDLENAVMEKLQVKRKDWK